GRAPTLLPLAPAGSGMLIRSDRPGAHQARGFRPDRGHGRAAARGVGRGPLLYQWGPGVDFVQRCAPTDSGLGEPGVPENVREILVRPIARPMPKVSNTADCDANSRRRARKPIELSGLRLPGKRPYRRVFGIYASLPI